MQRGFAMMGKGGGVRVSPYSTRRARASVGDILQQICPAPGGCKARQAWFGN